ncbi:ATP-binding protein [Pantanalinema rosaneae CENA516]|uniref:ATP-binding protein n=1 Tax=Pantanalinema rosaneae TaxID=1620701 RepID=UPI003D6F6CC8
MSSNTNLHTLPNSQHHGTPVAAELPNGKERSPTITLKTFALAAIAAHLPASSSEPELQFLQHQRQQVDPQQQGWHRRFATYLEQPSPIDQPLLQLAVDLSLTPIELLAVALAAAVEADAIVGRALARIQAPLGGSRPTLSLLSTALAAIAEPGMSPIHSLINGVAVHSGLLQLMQEGAPLPERSVRIPLHLWSALEGEDGTWAGTTIGLGTVPPVPLPASLLTTAQHQAESLHHASRLLILRTGSLAEGRSVAAAIAQCLQCRPLFIETDLIPGLSPWLLLRRLLPVFCLDLAPGERKILPHLPFYSGPMLVLCGPDGSPEMGGADVLNWVIPVPDRSERQTLWQQAVENPDLAADLACYHRHGSGRIAQLGRLAQHYSRLNHHPQPIAADVVQAAWTGAGVGLDALAQPLAAPIPDDALVVTPALREELDNLLLRCRSRDGLVQGLGTSATARYHPGVCALLVGPSGTGKTLAVGWLATRLGMPLYRVDLAAVVSKYIGETEKNLAQLLARAEQAEVILLFDEADSLFGKRTEVQQSTDRFANAQTNYLLQRIESYDGITLLTSNSRTRFDNAFSRRLDLVIEFPLPRPQERRSLWQSHLGSHHTLTAKDLNQIATTTDLCGGHIRNAVLAAAVFAQAENRPIDYNDVLQGLTAEYRKLGRQLPVTLKAGD